MPVEWRRYQLGRSVSIKHGWPFKANIQRRTHREADRGEHRQLSIHGRLSFRVHNIKEYLGELPETILLKPRDILLVMTCQTPGGEILGIPARVPDDGRIYLHNQRMGKVVVTRPDLLDHDFFIGCFCGRTLTRSWSHRRQGRRLYTPHQHGFEAVPSFTPTAAEQRTIARVLGALDDKIELDRRMNRTLEDLTAGAVSVVVCRLRSGGGEGRGKVALWDDCGDGGVVSGQFYGNRREGPIRQIAAASR